MAGGMTSKQGSASREPRAACGCGSPGFAHYRSLHPGRDQLAEEVRATPLVGQGEEQQRPSTSSNP